MNIQEILRGLLDIVERGQNEQDDIEQANLEMSPIIDTTELSMADAESEFDAEQGIDTSCGCDDSVEMNDFPELDVVKRNAGIPGIVLVSDGTGGVV